MIGWQSVRFNRTDRPKALNEYLNPPPTPDERRNQRVRATRAMLERLAEQRKDG